MFHIQNIYFQILKLLISFVDNSTEEIWKGYLYAVLLFLTQVLSTIFFQNYTNQVDKNLSLFSRMKLYDRYMDRLIEKVIDG